MARNARRAGADALMLIAPYTNDMNEPGLAEYYRAVAGEAQLPCFLYQTKWSGVLRDQHQRICELAVSLNKGRKGVIVGVGGDVEPVLRLAVDFEFDAQIAE